MKRMVWFPQRLPRKAVLLVAAIALIATATVELWKNNVERPHYEERLAAAELAERGMQIVKRERLRLGLTIDERIDPAGVGMLGASVTPITSIAGSLSSKRTSCNPNFAAAVVDMLRRSGVQPGDTIAVGYTGSYPALNLSVLAAVEVMKLKPVIVASAASSQYGANFPDLLWLDMERELHDRQCFSHRSIAASLGGLGDVGIGMSDDAKRLLAEGIRRNNLPLLEAESLDEAIETRMKLYKKHSRGATIKAYINVGGGTVSNGQSLGKKLFRIGLNMRPPKGSAYVEGVMNRFISEGVPAIHLVHASDLAEKYGLPVDDDQYPVVGEGAVFVEKAHSRPLAAVLLCAMVGGLFFIARRRTEEADVPAPHFLRQRPAAPALHWYDEASEWYEEERAM